MALQNTLHRVREGDLWVFHFQTGTLNPVGGHFHAQTATPRVVPAQMKLSLDVRLFQKRGFGLDSFRRKTGLFQGGLSPVGIKA